MNYNAYSRIVMTIRAWWSILFVYRDLHLFKRCLSLEFSILCLKFQNFFFKIENIFYKIVSYIKEWWSIHGFNFQHGLGSLETNPFRPPWRLIHFKPLH